MTGATLKPVCSVLTRGFFSHARVYELLRQWFRATPTLMLLSALAVELRKCVSVCIVAVELHRRRLSFTARVSTGWEFHELNDGVTVRL